MAETKSCNTCLYEVTNEDVCDECITVKGNPIPTKYKEKLMDMVNKPPHYQTKTGLETIDVIEAFTDGLNGIEATDTGNVIKYICRWPKKGTPILDLMKARDYIDHLISKVEEKEKEKESK